MSNVNFKKGISTNYSGLSSYDDDTFYVTTDDLELYLGEEKLTSHKEYNKIQSIVDNMIDSGYILNDGKNNIVDWKEF